MARREHWSVIWKMPSDEFEQLCKKSSTMVEILKAFSRFNGGSNYETVRRRAKEEGIDLSHLHRGSDYFKYHPQTGGKTAFPLKEVMTQNSTYSRRALKIQLLKHKVLKNICAICRMKPEWNGKPLTLILDHINGARNDARQENLRLVCPNCNSQLDTHCKGNKRKSPEVSLKFCSCGTQLKMKKSTKCLRCALSARQKIEWPELTKLRQMVNMEGTLNVAQTLGVSSTAIYKKLHQVDQKV